MPAILTYWQVPEDEKEFLDFLLSTGKILVLPNAWVKTREELVPQALLSYIEKCDPDQLKFGLEHHVRGSVVEERTFDDQVYFGITTMRSCVVSYDRGRLRDGNHLGQSNLCAYWDYPDEGTMTLTQKNPDFVKWAERVFARVRGIATECLDCNGHGYPATSRVKKAVEKGDLKVVLY
jgi:hypothetical protein